MQYRMHSRCLILALVFSACGLLPVKAIAQSSGPSPEHIPDYSIERFGERPSVPTGSLSPALQFAARVAFIDSTALSTWDDNQEQALAAIERSADPRFAWVISDMLRFMTAGRPQKTLARAASKLLGKDFEGQNAWHDLTNHLIAWDIPAPPEYLKYKAAIFNLNLPGWEELFIEGSIDWRLVSWGGVTIDDRPFNNTDTRCRGCIPAVDNPVVSHASDTTWLQDSDIVFGVEVNGEARAYPRQIMEVREMVNDSLGGRDLGIPYCTLCGAAQAYFTDNMPEGIKRPVLRTSGLLSRSNKVMYDLNTHSIIDTFRGSAVTGPLAEAGIKLSQTTVITTDWGTWKRDYPETTVLPERYALGRNPDFRNSRDANGPIFPIGDVDPRLPVHEDVIGVLNEFGDPVAFPRGTALIALAKGSEVIFENIQLQLDAGGIRAIDENGSDLGSHQAFWFAWSQFYPQTELWVPGE